jgi:hypothetical protein
MPRFLDTLGDSDIAIFICDRCKMKRAHSTARSDPNFPGLLVCDQGCADEKDPYRLAARQTEKITIRFPRPDANIAVDDNALVVEPYGGAVLSIDTPIGTTLLNGNLDGLGIQP